MSNDVKEKIRTTLLQLSGQTSIEKINVSMLVRECNVSRTLFYYYYQDIYDVLQDILCQEMEKVIGECLSIPDSERSVCRFVELSVQQFPLMRRILHTKYYEDAEKLLTRTVKKYLRIAFYQKVGDIPVRTEEAEFILDFMASGLTAYLFRLCELPSIDAEQIGRHLHRFIHNSVAAAF